MKVTLVTKSLGVGQCDGLTVDEIVVQLARVSSDKQLWERHEDPKKLIKYCWENGHVSIFEQVNFGFEIETSLAIAAQILRHRSAKFQQFSRRYNGKAPEFEPIELRKVGATNRQGSLPDSIPHDHPARYAVTEFLSDASMLYQSLIEGGVAPECARMILPQATKTTMYATNDLRSWIFYVNQRASTHAQKEHQQIATAIKEVLWKECPIVAEAVWG